MYDDIKRILRDTYELEGLLLLADNRGEETPEVVISAIIEKAESIANDAKQLNNAATVNNDTPHQTSEPSNESIADDCSDEMVKGFVEEVLSESSPEISELQEDQPSDETFSESTTTDNDIEETIIANNTEIPEEIPVEEINEPEIVDEKNTEVESNGNSAKITLDEAFIRNKSKDLHNAFSLNDMFRFRRELFGNSAAEMTDAINLVDAMGTYPEAEDYFYNDLGWDKDSEEVAEFMAIIKNHFL